MQKHIFLVFLFASIACSCTATDSLMDSGYPPEIVRLRLQQQYDQTRWYIYCTSCYRQGELRKGGNFYKTFGELSLVLDFIKINNDTTEINLLFYDKGKPINNQLRISPPWGCVYWGKSCKVMLVTGSDETRYYGPRCRNLKILSTCVDRSTDIKYDLVKKYLNDKGLKVDPWFRKEAIRRGVIKK